jgi:hypothetical protein
LLLLLLVLLLLLLLLLLLSLLLLHLLHLLELLRHAQRQQCWLAVAAASAAQVTRLVVQPVHVDAANERLDDLPVAAGSVASFLRGCQAHLRVRPEDGQHAPPEAEEAHVLRPGRLPVRTGRLVEAVDSALLIFSNIFSGAAAGNSALPLAEDIHRR